MINNDMVSIVAPRNVTETLFALSSCNIPARTRIGMLYPFNTTRAERIHIDRWMSVGIYNPLNGTNDTIGFAGWSHEDVMSLVLESLEAGHSKSTLFIVNGDRIGTGLTREWLSDYCPILVTRTVFINTFRLTHRPMTIPVILNQRFGANPQNYAQFGLPGHDGVDLHAPVGTPIFSMKSGVAYTSNHPSLGLNVRVQSNFDGLIYEIAYAHMSSMSVSSGETVFGGRQIGLAGLTGNTTGPHLHIRLKVFPDVTNAPTYQETNGTTWPFNLHDVTPYLREIGVGGYIPDHVLEQDRDSGYAGVLGDPTR